MGSRAKVTIDPEGDERTVREGDADEAGEEADLEPSESALGADESDRAEEAAREAAPREDEEETGGEEPAARAGSGREAARRRER